MGQKMKADAKAASEREAQEAAASAVRLASLMQEHEEMEARVAAAEASKLSSAADAEALRIAHGAIHGGTGRGRTART